MKLFAPLTAIALTGCSVFGIRSGTPEPPYKLIATAGPVQIRQYAPRLAASVTVPGDEIAARSTGFRRLASYIFGANITNTSIAMTAPVAQTSAKIAMTAPVAVTGSQTGWTITFIMPANYTAASIPKPKDPGIIISTTPAQTYAVYRFSGIPSANPVHKAKAILLATLKTSGWHPTGGAESWFYDPPWTLPFARRNEVAIPVTAKP